MDTTTEGENVSMGINDGTNADGAQAALEALLHKVRGLADNYGARATSAPVPFARWGDIERDLRVVLGEYPR